MEQRNEELKDSLDEIRGFGPSHFIHWGIRSRTARQIDMHHSFGQNSIIFFTFFALRKFNFLIFQRKNQRFQNVNKRLFLPSSA